MSRSEKLSTDPYKGVRDFYPEDQFIQSYIKAVWRKTVESFGYQAYDASILEPTELYKAKSGEEIVNEQTYSFKDRGERDVTLRPEMTPTVARMVAAKRRELKYPLRWFSIPNLFRYERPQRGRLREHWQLNCDIFGVPGIEAEIEMISIAYQIMKNFGISDDKFEVRINSRTILDAEFAKLGLSEEKSHALKKLLDKKHKVKNFDEEAEKILGKKISIEIKPDDVLNDIISKLALRGITNVVFDQDLVRGFDYYTGMVFEVYDLHPDNNRALFGGGRYDNLLSIFDAEPVPTVGFGMGDVTMRDVLMTYGLLPEYRSSTDIAVLPFEEQYFEAADKVASALREMDVNVSVDYSNKKIGDKIGKADKEKVTYVIVIGEEEAKSEKYKLKELSTKEEFEGSVEEIAHHLSCDCCEDK